MFTENNVDVVRHPANHTPRQKQYLPSQTNMRIKSHIVDAGCGKYIRYGLNIISVLFVLQFLGIPGIKRAISFCHLVSAFFLISRA
jgi:hypothetical protein